MSYYLSQRSRENLLGVLPDLISVVSIAIGISTQDFGITARAVRTAEEQHALFLKGVTQKDGYTSKSNHQPWSDGLGHAVDLTPYVSGFIIDDRAWRLYPAIASAMSVAAKSLGMADRLMWGCNWIEPMGHYGSTIKDMTAAMERYKVEHPGRDFLDGPHFQMS